MAVLFIPLPPLAEGRIPETPAVSEIAGRSPATIELYPPAAVIPVGLPQYLCAPTVFSVIVTAPVDELLVANVPSPLKLDTPDAALLGLAAKLFAVLSGDITARVQPAVPEQEMVP